MSRPPVTARWVTFARERYEPISHLALAACFALGNGAVALGATGAAARPRPLVAAVALAFLFFLRLRIFDELKDLDTDRVANPGRPLARGLVTVREARLAAGLVAAAELAIAAGIGWHAVGAWAAAFAYSLAMLVEFGAGPWLRPRLELYAVTHTLVAAWLGLALAALAAGVPVTDLPLAVWLFAPANWAVFNVFEFSRKTFAPGEEREGVPTYSSRWGPVGAAALTLGWATAALLSAWAALSSGAAGWIAAGAVGLGLAATLLGAFYVAAPGKRSALALRGGMIVWATLFYAAVVTAQLARSS